MTQHFVLGTAGHIDHGKSSLICALTGTDPDRLAEEKRRGITIELGFAQLTLPSGRTMGVVDVPGHERFVRQMVAGATGVDVALLVIAADDGIMPQTTEHVAVLELLGIKTCVVALTKIDLVDPEWVAFMTEEIAGRLEGSAFAGAPICPVSSRTGEGLEELKAAIDTAAAHAAKTKPEGTMRMPVDRVFTVKGFGTVITGTLWAGQVHVGDELTVLPQGVTSRVRSIQMHGKDFELAECGNRVALCLTGLSTQDIRPGNFLAAAGTLGVTDRFDAELTYADPFRAGKPLKSGTVVRVAHGTNEVTGRLLCMNEKPWLKPGEQDMVQIRLDEPLPLSAQDRFIVRSESPVRVIAGGRVLLTHPRRRTTLSAGEQAILDALRQGDEAAAFSAYVGAMTTPVALEDMARDLSLPKLQAQALTEQACQRGTLMVLDEKAQLFARPATVQKTLAAMENTLLAFHAGNKTAVGIPREELRVSLASKPDKAVFDALLALAEARGLAIHADGLVSHPRAGAGARALEEQTGAKLLAALREAGANPPVFATLIDACQVDEAVARKALAAQVAAGTVVRITADLHYAAEVVEAHKAAVAAHIEANGPSPAADLKDAMGVSRKYAMPLLEYFDSIGFTRRSGDVRTLA